MKHDAVPILRDLVLIGGGHSHAIALKQFGMNPLPGVQLTLITDVSHTPYSGMLPGYVAGLYDFDECHIDLRPLARFAGARMIVDQAIGLNLEHNWVLCADHPPIAFDLLSIDIGSTPATFTVPGATEYAIPVKPISRFLRYWDQLRQQIAQQPDAIRLGIVGGGAGGVELAFGVQSCLQEIYQSTPQSRKNSTSNPLELHLFQRGDRLLPERDPWVGNRVEQILSQRGVHLHLGETVVEVQAPDHHLKMIHCESGLSVKCDDLFWVTQAGAAPWLGQSGLATDERGFVLVNDCLQSLSHPQVFAAGDVATLVNYPRPKAGVFAVRQGQPLGKNLHRALLNQSLKPFVPQKQFLILIGTGDERAIASKAAFGLGPWGLLWWWKDHIDRKFMHQFTHLSAPMNLGLNGSPIPNPDTKTSSSIQRSESSMTVASLPEMHCRGCGSKMGGAALSQVLQRIQRDVAALQRQDILLGLSATEDGAVISVPPGQVLVQTVDYFPALIDDPFRFGQITANHCLNDLYAMGANPQSALAIVTLPYGTPAKLADTLYLVLMGVTQGLREAGAVLVGGHTMTGAELALGLSCNGLAEASQLWRKQALQPGQQLILTKPLGTGTLFAAEMQLQARGRWIETAVTSMLQSNRAAAECFRHYQATACTDITGFGLLGHLGEMVRASQVEVELDLDVLPVLPGALETLQRGLFSSLHQENMELCGKIFDLGQFSPYLAYPLLFDPQTAGGLLASVPHHNAPACLAALQRQGYAEARIVGTVIETISGTVKSNQVFQ